MKQYYTNNTMFVITLIFSKIKKLEGFCGFGNSGKKIFFAFLLLFFFAENTSAQCSINSTRATTGLVCGTAPLSNCGGILYIGDGTTTMSLTIDSGFDLSCLGAIQFIIRDRATVQYGNGANDRLTLAEGSSIIVLAGGRIDGGSGCNSSDRIYIGTKLVATCSGNANTESSFSDIVSLGGTGSVNSNSPVCVGNSINLTANPPPNGMFDYSWTGPDNFSSILQNPSAFPATSLSGGKYSLVMTRTNDGQKAYSEVTVVVNPVPTTAIAGSNQSQCNTSSFTLSGNAPTIGTGAWSVVIGTATITTAASRTSGVTGVAVGTSATLRWTITNGTCTSRSDVILTNNALPTITGTLNVCLGATIALTGSGTADTTTPWTSGTPSFATVSNSGVVSGIASGTSVITYKNNNGCTITATVTVNSLPNNTTNGFVATTICTGGSPQLTFDAEDSSFSLPYNISYKNVSTGNSYTVSIPSAAPFSFTPGDNPISDAVYRLVSINKAGCERTTGFGKTSAELRVRPIPTALISGASAVCVGSTLPNIIISNPRTNQITVSYSINNMVQTSVDIRAGEQISLQALTTTAGDFIYQLISVVYTFSPSCSTALSDNVKVTINALPTITSATAAASPICTNTITTLTANGVTGAGITLTWWSGTGGTGTNYGTGLTLPNAGPGTYFARVTGTCTLAVEASVIVTEQALPNAGTNGTLTVCAGTTPTNAQLFGALLGTPTAGGSWSAPVAGVYTYTVAATAPCTVNATATVTVTQQALPNAGINGTLTVCAGTTLNNTQLFAALLGAPTAGGSWSAPVADVYTYTVAATAPCTVAATATVTVDETAPVADAGAAFTKTCTSNPDGKTIGVAPVADVTYAWLPIAGLSNAAIANPTANPTTTTTYTVTATNSTSGCTAISIVLVTVDIATTTWKELTPGTLGWSNGGVPSLNDIIVFADDYILDKDVSGCYCSVYAGKNVTIKSGKTMKIVNGVSVLGTGTLTFENNASLVQINDNASNDGNIIYKRAVTGIKAKDYVYWSTPVRGQELAKFSSTIKYLWSASGNNWRLPTLPLMQIGQGYIIRQDVAVDFTGTFTGIPNNGIITISIGGTGSFNLIGNPYPSALDASQFLDINSGVLGGTIYFWTHITPITLRADLPPGTAGSGDLAYTSDDYAAWNSTGGLATYAARADKVLLRIPSGKIAAGQAFFATSIAPGKQAVFENTMRLDKAGDILDNSQFFKINSNSKTSITIEKNRLWLNLTNTQGAFKQTLIGYIKGATNEYDNVYDGVSFNGNAYIDFYSVQNSKNYAIQGRALPFDDNDIVPLGYKTTIVGEFKISIDKADGVLVNKKIYLEDKLLGITQDLSLAPYTFTTEKGTFNDRFVLSYVDKVTLGTDDFETVKNAVIISSKNKEFKIQSKVELIDKVMVYDVSGKLIKEKKKIENTELILSGINASEQVFIVKVFLINGTTISKKIIY